jgi:hypothetical protein
VKDEHGDPDLAVWVADKMEAIVERRLVGAAV